MDGQPLNYPLPTVPVSLPKDQRLVEQALRISRGIFSGDVWLNGQFSVEPYHILQWAIWINYDYFIPPLSRVKG